MEQLYSLIGARVRAQRKRLNMTQENLANQIGTSEQYISRIERGLACPSLGFIYEISKALGCSVYQILPSTVSEKRSFLSEEVSYLLEHCSYEQKKFIVDLIFFCLTHSGIDRKSDT